MSKGHVNLTIDNDILAESKLARINLSQTLEEHLKYVLSNKKNNIESINIVQVTKENELIKEKINTLSAKLKTNTESIQQWKEYQASIEAKRLEEQKKEIIQKQTCLKCNQLIENFEFAKKDKTKDGKYLHSKCVLETTREQRREWFGV